MRKSKQFMDLYDKGADPEVLFGICVKDLEALEDKYIKLQREHDKLKSESSTWVTTGSYQKIWGMGLLGVDTSLAPRIAEEFESLILHQI